VKVTIAGADVSRYYNGDQFGRTSVQLSAFDLEVGLGTVVIPEIAGTDAFVTGRQCMVEQGTTVLVDGFIASDDRGRLETEPTKPRREWTMSLEDANAITSNIRAIDWTRSSETCTARILARISADGFSVDTTWVQSTSATLPAKKYKTGDIWSELATDAIERTGWTLFVHDKAGGGRCFHFHSLTTGHACGLSITDVMGAWDNVTSFVPINPRRIRDPADLRSDIILEDQNGRTAHVTDSTSIAAHDADGRRHQEYVQVDADSQADLDLQAARMLLDRKDDITTYECTIGPLNETALGSIRVGDMMTVTSQVFGLTASSQRIANMTLTPLGPTLWTATLELSRPVRHGNKIPGMDGGRDGGGTGGGGNSDPALGDQHCDDCPPFQPTPFSCPEGCSDVPSNSAEVGSSGTSWEAQLYVKHSLVDNDGSNHPTGPAHTETAAGPSFSKIMTTGGGLVTSIADEFHGPSPFPGDPFHANETMDRRYASFVKPSFPAVSTHWPSIRVQGDIFVTVPGDVPSLVMGVPWQLVAVYYDGTDLQAAQGNGLLTALDLLDYPQTTIASGVHTSGAGTTSVPGPGESIDVAFAADESKNRIAFFIKTSTTKIVTQVSGGAYQWVDRYPLWEGYVFGGGGGVTVSMPSYTISYCLCTFTESTPTSGQAVTNETAPSGDGTTTTFSTKHAYMPGSLFVKVNGVNWTGDIASQDPTTGSFTFTHAPKPAADIVVDYRAA
jgi:hypothetical protein